MIRLLLILALLLAAPRADAWLIGGGGPAAGYVGPGDVVTGATAWYGLRGYNAAVSTPGTTNAVKLRRASDNTTSNIVILASGDLDTATAATFCNATSCFVDTLYDQTGGGRDVVQATAANQPAFVFNCIGALPCFEENASAQLLQSAANYTAGSTISLSVVANEAGPTGSSYIISVSSYWLIFTQASVVNQEWGWTPFGAGEAATNGSWYSAQGIGPSTFFLNSTKYTDGGVPAYSPTAAKIQIARWVVNTTDVKMTEAGFWDGTSFTDPQALNVTSNQRAYWGF